MQRRLAWPTLVAALSLSTPIDAATPDGVWSAAAELGNAVVEIRLTVPADGSPVRAELRGADGFGSDLGVEGWTVEDDGIRFRLTGLDRPYRFAGEQSGDRLDGVLEREPPAVPSTDLFLLPLGQSTDGRWAAAPQALTDRDGYDNQPAFLADGTAVLYTSMRGGQTDIYRHDLATGTSHRLTETTESEYSPTPLPGGDGFSTVRVEADGAQRLWAFDREGGSPRLLLASVQPVGYHAWIDSGTVALFVLGEPPTLQIATLESGTATVVDRSIGRSLHRSPDKSVVTYVAKRSATDWTLRELGVDGGPHRDLVPTLAGREDFVWTPAKTLLMADGSRLFGTTPGSDDWREVANLADHGVREITRLAIDPDGSRLVLVGTRPDPSPLPGRLEIRFERQVNDG